MTSTQPPPPSLFSFGLSLLIFLSEVRVHVSAADEEHSPEARQE